MLTTNSIVSTLGAYMPTMESVSNVLAPNYDWIDAGASTVRTMRATSSTYSAILYSYCSVLSCSENINMAELAAKPAAVAQRPDLCLALAHFVNALSVADRTQACLTGIEVGLGRCGAVTNGLAACAMLAAYAKEGDFLGMGLSAGKLSAIAAFGSNPAVDAALDFLCARYAGYRSTHPVNPGNAAGGQNQLNPGNAVGGQNNLAQANAVVGQNQAIQVNVALQAIQDNLLNFVAGANSQHLLRPAAWLHTHIGRDSSGAQDEPGRLTAPQL